MLSPVTTKRNPDHLSIYLQYRTKRNFGCLSVISLYTLIALFFLAAHFGQRLLGWVVIAVGVTGYMVWSKSKQRRRVQIRIGKDLLTVHSGILWFHKDISVATAGIRRLYTDRQVDAKTGGVHFSLITEHDSQPGFVLLRRVDSIGLLLELKQRIERELDIVSRADLDRRVLETAVRELRQTLLETEQAQENRSPKAKSKERAIEELERQITDARSALERLRTTLD